jgi:hypothetical protein
MTNLLGSGAKEYEVVFSGLDKALLDSVRPLARTILQREDDVLLILESQTDADALIRQALSQGARLVSLTPRRETLEEYFIREVSRKPEQGKSEGAAA